MSEIIEKCEVCRALLDEEELFCANCGREAPRRENVDQPIENRLWTHHFECDSCGASMSYDPSAQRLRCPFCGSERLQRREDVKGLSPRTAVEMTVSREQAQQKLRAWLGAGFWRPSDLAKQSLVTSMSAVYVPCWVFRAATRTYWTADTNQTPPGARADWYPLWGDHDGRHAGILVAASGAIAAAELDEVADFDLSRAKPVEQIRFDEATVEQFRVPRKYARPLARGQLERREVEACRRHVPGRARNVKVNVRLHNLASEPMLLPVWIMAYRYRGEAYRSLVNGQTGTATGQAPTSIWKVALAILLALAAAAGLLALAALTMR